MKRVLHISHTYPLNEESGITPFVHHVVEQAAEEGHQVHVLVPEHDELEAFGNVQFHTFSYASEGQMEYKGVSPDKEKIPVDEVLKFVWHGYRAASRLDKEHDFDIVHAHWSVPSGVPAMLLKHVHGLSLVVHTHGRDVYNIPEIGYDVPSDFRARAVIKSVLRAADHIIANSENCYSYAKKLGAAPEKSSIIPYGVDLEDFSPDRFSTAIRNQYDGGDFFLLYVGDLIYRKGVQDAIAAVQRADADVRFVIIGTGAYEEELKEQASDAENITFLGFQPHDKVASYMATADVLVVPSLIEAFGVVNIEALACGTPVIGARTGGIQDIVDETVGRLFDPEDVETLTHHIDELADNPETREKLGKSARERATTRYNWCTFGDKLDRVYQQL